MANLADLDFAISQPCRHCNGLLYGRVRFCPYCGADEAQAAAFGADPPDAALEPVTAIEDPVFIPRHDAPEKKGISVFLDAFNQDKEESGSEVACYVPPAFEWQKELPAMVAVERPTPASPRGAILQRWVVGVGVGAAAVLLALALVLGSFHAGKSDESDRSHDFASKLAQAQSALGRGDLSAAARSLGMLVAAYPDHPGVRELRDELDQRTQEQLARREQLREATVKAAQALGLQEPLPPPAPAEAAPAAEAETHVLPAPPAAEPGCSEALAALALCPDAQAAESARRVP